MFVTALSIKHKGLNQLRCPSTEDLTKKIQYISIEYYSTMKKNETPSFAEKWVELWGHRVK